MSLKQYFWVRVNQRLYFPPQCYCYAFRPNVALACYQKAGRVGSGGRTESPLTLAESRAIDLPWPNIFQIKTPCGFLNGIQMDTHYLFINKLSEKILIFWLWFILILEH